ncbi:hypothetical protein N7457_008264 [Penicillium paradoxum]|uniref:uncharacterized protein n=1 Tax=Penicillium paradoxum TaxID=176176 RepID=UPI002548353F|nr:uncharacterized protein N7457_008264 [Penicillium paradoxum]KAJ5773368.1 hypothetical protein N7457_008264 [Penicillium paradoxum]
MFPHPRPPPPREDEMYMTNTISEDMSVKGAPEEGQTTGAFGQYVNVGHNDMPYTANHQAARQHQVKQDYSFQMMLLQQQERQNARRLQMALAERDLLRQESSGSENPAASLEYRAVANSQARPGQYAPAPVPHNPYPQGSVLGYNNAPYAPQRPQTRTPDSVDSYGVNQQYANNARPVMYTPPSQGSVSLSEANDLKSQITALQAKVRELEGKPGVTTASRYQILYRIEKDLTYPGDNRGGFDSNYQFRPMHELRENTGFSITHNSAWMGIYSDPPELIHRNMGAPYLRCNDPLTNFELYLALNRDISFIVFRNYKRRVERESPNARYTTPKPFSESILPVSEDLKEVIGDFLSAREFQSMNNDFRGNGQVHSPYLFIYHSRGAKELEAKQRMSSEAQRQFDLFLDYIQETRGEEYAAADLLLEKGKIRPEYLQYLFKSTDLLVSTKDKEETCHVAMDWPIQVQTGSSTNPSWYINGQTWGFDGDFYKIHTRLDFEIPESRDSKELKSPQLGQHFEQLSQLPSYHDSDKDSKREYAITDLVVFPIRYASEDLVRKLQRRGETFWKLRTRQYVSYQATEEENFQTMADDRYIIDMNTYNRLHPGSNDITKRFGNVTRIPLDEQALAKEHPPPGSFTMLMPPRITGFNLRRKKWFDLSVDRISEVQWNKKAFESLAIDSKSRELIEALVTKYLEPDYSADLIAGKGNGLILLLHGGPGTGKTLTAESVAERAERPLYRVTCGDVGTKPEEVEKYLESVLHLGKIWNCVVLLDEADVFLEQRGLEDLNRNALVSAFLRVVEYFEGILIMTTNRVGTFDEAFKSRIQLALHYPPLGEEQRRIIWKTFIERLDGVGREPADVENLLESLDVLQGEKLNGRQIRNTITTARQYSKWKGEVLTYDHLKDVIEVSAKFDDYLENIHVGGHM